MRRITKLMLGIAGFLIMAGGLLALTGRIMGAQRVLNVNLNGYEMQLHLLGVSSVNNGRGHGFEPSYESSDNTSRRNGETGARNLNSFTSIVIDVSMVDVVFEQAEDYGVKLTWNNEKLAMDFSSDNNTLQVWKTHNSINLGGGNYSGKVTVYLPKNANLEDVNIINSMGDIEASALRTSYASFSNSMGDISLNDLTAETLDFSNSMGEIVAEDCTVAETLTADNSMGDIKLSGKFGGSIDLSNSMANITFATSLPASEFGYDLSTSMAEIKVDGKTYENSASRDGGNSYLSAENSMGDIRVTFGS